MALVTCPDCGREVSERAPACPGCGAPVAEAPSAAPSYRHVQAIEQTGKRWKKLHVVGTAEVFASFLGFPFIADEQWATVGWAWLLGFLGLGFATVVYAKFGMWWHHR